LVVPTAIVFAVKSALFEGLFPKLLTKLALFDRFADFSNGLFDLSAIALYLSLAVVFVVFTVLAAEKKRWN
jgi:ABC-2 type transport system permease protein